MEPLRRGCRRACTNSCSKARDGRCHDGWLGDETPVGRPDCPLGSDCADCGARQLCGLPGTKLTLPLAVLPNAQTTSLRLSQIIFMVMGSTRYRQRTLRTQRTWCSIDGVRCLFFSDDSPVAGGDSVGHSELDREPFPSVRVRAPRPPRSCCTRRGRSKSFFCEHHRLITLQAQYRFLPALQVVRTSAAFKAGKFRWVVLVDDDSFVFPRRLRWLLSRLDYRKLVYLGDFGSSGEATQMHIPHFACGGGGSILSAAALERMELMDCLRQFRGRCMQSDWMIGGCARRHNVSFLRELGCGTCDPRRIDVKAIYSRLKEDRCFFLQNADAIAKHLPSGAHSPAILHGLGTAEATESFFWKHASHFNRTGSQGHATRIS
ncbi:hypothetical protein AB1Y20_003167 [Prymnesium parvum]|uniref:Fringe-like glycosyltransferase domain-containing protein n=1 Tax=Prymnesium parvum TaxID=97485 RepID=A0AB34JCM8_PRYPA